MKFVMRSTLCLGVFIFQSLVCNVFSSPHPILDSESSGFLPLQAARAHSDINRRGDTIRLSNSASLLYVNEQNDWQQPVVFSRVQIESDSQFLLLEEIDHHLEQVDCTDSTIGLRFTTEQAFVAAKAGCVDLVGGHVITSHDECYDNGARVPYLVHSISFSDTDLTMKLSTSRKEWNEAFHSFKLEYGYTNEGHELRSQGKLNRRQDSGTPTSTFLSATGIIPTSTPSAKTLSLDLSHEESDTTFKSPIGGGPSIPISIGCKQCKTTGSLKLTQADFNVTILDNVTSPKDYIQSGSLSLEMNGFSAHVDLQIEPSFSGSLSHALFSVPVFGFVIPRLGKAGIMFEPTVAFDWELKGGISLSYGFQLTVPDKSQITIDLANPENSSVVGFGKTTVAPIPFQANTSDIELSMGLHLNPRISIAFSFLDNQVLAETGAFLGLPTTNISITQLATASNDINCEASNGTSLDPSSIDFSKVFQNLTHIAPNVGMDVGLDIRLQASNLLLKNAKYQTSMTLLGTAFPLPTACLAFQPKGGTFAPAATAFAEMKASVSSAAAKASSAAHGGAKKNAGVGDRVRNPLGGVGTDPFPLVTLVVIVLAGPTFLF